MSSPITPCIFYRDPKAALEWLERVFGFELGMMVVDSEGRVGHAEISWRGVAIAVGPEWSYSELIGPATLKSPASIGGVGTQFLRIGMDDGLDEHCARARAAGARITQAPADQFYGDRIYRALDLEGHVWVFTQTIAAPSMAEMEKASGLTFQDIKPKSPAEA